MLEQWIIAMAVLLTLFHPELTESSSNFCLVKDKRQIKRVGENSTEFVSCPELKEDEKLISISLHKGDTELHSTDMRNNTHPPSWQPFQVSKRNNSFSYKILRVEANDTGPYSCKIQTDTKHMESKTILLVIKDAQQPTSCPTEHMPLPLYIGYGIIMFYNLIITVFSCYFARKLKTTEPPENPYMNTRPGGFRRR
ncbi:unnamed protein product [Leuciscus chuanchicus]